jgi:hypothetical protein
MFQLLSARRPIRQEAILFFGSRFRCDLTNSWKKRPVPDWFSRAYTSFQITHRTAEEFELIVDDGTPQALILSRAEEWLADLIIVGSHGQTSASDALLGSVTDSIIRHAHCPVLIARSGEHTGRIDRCSQS